MSIPLVRILCWGVVLGFGFFFFFRWFEHAQVFHPWKGLGAGPDSVNLHYEDLRLRTADGVNIHAWWMPHMDSDITVVFCHGNAGNLSGRLDTFAELNTLGVNTLAFDYRGFGLSEGKPSEEGTILDALASIAWVKENRPDDKLVLYGRSLGGAVAVQAATRQVVDGLIIESTFTSVPEIGKQFFPFLPVALLGKIQYDSLSALPTLEVPLLIAHSPEDTLIPYEMGERLFAVANEPRQFIALRGGHNELPFYTLPGYSDTLRTFFSDFPL